MKDEQRITALEDELKILKNEVKAVLLDLREQYLNIQNPFNQTMVPRADGLNSNMRLEQKEDPKDIGQNQENSNSESETENTAAEIEVPEEQIPEIELPKYANSARSQYETISSQGSDIHGNELQSMYFRNDLAGFRPHSETSKTEDYDQGSSPRNATTVTENKRDQEGSSNNRQVDLVVIAGLTQWLDQAITKLGKERTQVLIEISFTMGRLPQNLKDALIRMAQLTHQEIPSSQSITASDYLSILAQLDNLLSGSKQQDNALLSIISMMKDSRNG
jgi:hypothetical protein